MRYESTLRSQKMSILIRLSLYVPYAIRCFIILWPKANVESSSARNAWTSGSLEELQKPAQIAINKQICGKWLLMREISSENRRLQVAPRSGARKQILLCLSSNCKFIYRNSVWDLLSYALLKTAMLNLLEKSMNNISWINAKKQRSNVTIVKLPWRMYKPTSNTSVSVE